MPSTKGFSQMLSGFLKAAEYGLWWVGTLSLSLNQILGQMATYVGSVGKLMLQVKQPHARICSWCHRSQQHRSSMQEMTCTSSRRAAEYRACRSLATIPIVAFVHNLSVILVEACGSGSIFAAGYVACMSTEGLACTSGPQRFGILHEEGSWADSALFRGLLDMSACDTRL